MEFEREMLIVFFVILLVWLLVSSYRSNTGNTSNEGFDVTGCQLPPIGAPQYGLRGDLLHTESIDSIYMKRFPDVRLSSTNNEMYDSNYSPAEQGVRGCVKVPCPCTADNYYEGSPCWQCTNPDDVEREL